MSSSTGKTFVLVVNVSAFAYLTIILTLASGADSSIIARIVLLKKFVRFDFIIRGIFQRLGKFADVAPRGTLVGDSLLFAMLCSASAEEFAPIT